MNWKQILRRLPRRFGVDVVHWTKDPVVAAVAAAREDVRLNSDPLRRFQCIARLAWRVHLRRLFELRRIDWALDVGANAGQFYHELRQAGFGGRVCSFEPLPECASYLTSLAEATPGWTVVPLALGRESGRRTLQVLADTALSSFLPVNATAMELWSGKTQITQELVVEVERLDAWLPRHMDLAAEARFFLKTDTQGSDFDVLAGAEGILSRVDIVQFEAAVHPMYTGAVRYNTIVAWLEQRGFELSGLFPVYVDPRTLELIEADCVMVRTTQ
jgi:FkbM family methyltransferase